jgi:single stranded DNA-binding protein
MAWYAEYWRPKDDERFKQGSVDRSTGLRPGDALYSEWQARHLVTWGNLAEICKQYLNNGQQVYIEGRLQTRGWEDDTGKKHFRTEVVANEMIMLGNRRSGEGIESYEDKAYDF